jgi:phosphoserine phosphatase
LSPSSFSQQAREFVESVVALRPAVAAFDCDGTLWSGDAGEGFFDWELRHGVVSEEVVHWARPRYADYQAGRVEEDVMCGEMVTLHHGLHESAVQRAADQYFEESMVGSIFPEMRELVQRLQDQHCVVWAVSSTNEWMIRSGMRHFGIPAERILAAAARIESGLVTDQLVRVPTGADKVKALQQVVADGVDAAFGNSRWDEAMLGFARHGFAVNPNPDLERVAQQRGWKIYFPASAA